MDLLWSVLFNMDFRHVVQQEDRICTEIRSVLQIQSVSESAPLYIVILDHQYAFNDSMASWSKREENVARI